MPQFNTPRRFQARPTKTPADSNATTKKSTSAVKPSPAQGLIGDGFAESKSTARRFLSRPSVRSTSGSRPAPELNVSTSTSVHTDERPSLPAFRRNVVESIDARLRENESDHEEEEGVEERNHVARDAWNEVEQQAFPTFDDFGPSIKRRRVDETELDEQDQNATAQALQSTQIEEHEDQSSQPLLESPTARRRFILRSPTAPPIPRFDITKDQRSALPPQSDISESPFRRPAFKIPPPSNDDTGSSTHLTPAIPLPDVFSPHRKGQRYIEGGLADTVRTWILDAAHVENDRRETYAKIIPSSTQQLMPTPFSSQSVASNAHSDTAARGILVKITGVDGDATAGQVVLAEGYEQSSGRESRLLLVPRGKMKSGNIAESGAVVERGCMIVAKAPVWPVNVLGVERIVVVDWRVLRPS